MDHSSGETRLGRRAVHPVDHCLTGARAAERCAAVVERLPTGDRAHSVSRVAGLLQDGERTDDYGRGIFRRPNPQRARPPRGRLPDTQSVILPKVRDPRFITIRRGGTLTDADHHCWRCGPPTCAEHVLDLFESARPDDRRPRQAIERARAWARGEIAMIESRAAGGHANAAARDLRGAPRHAAYAAGQAAVVAHVAAHELGAAAYAIKAARAAAPATRPRGQGGSSAGGSATSSRRRSASWCSTTSGCATTSAGRCSTSDGRARPARRPRPRPQ